MSFATLPYRVPERAGKSAPPRLPAIVSGAVAGIGILLSLPGQARADRGHAEITLGFPHGQVTVGKTWDDDPRTVIVETEADDDDDRVVVEEHRCPPPAERVTIIERAPEPVYVDREVRVVRHVYVESPACERPEAVSYRRYPQRVIYAPSRTVIVAPGGGFHGRGHGHGGYGGFRDRDFRDRGFRGRDGHGDYGNRGNDDHGNHGAGSGGDRGYQGGSHNPVDLFPEDHGRPARERGVRHIAQR